MKCYLRRIFAVLYRFREAVVVISLIVLELQFMFPPLVARYLVRPGTLSVRVVQRMNVHRIIKSGMNTVFVNKQITILGELQNSAITSDKLPTMQCSCNLSREQICLDLKI